MVNQILHVCGSMGIGGLQRALYQLIREQRNAGLNADLLVSSLPSYYASKSAEAGARIFLIRQKSGVDLSVKKKFYQIVKEYDYKIIHFHAPNPALMYISSKLNQIRLYYTHRSGAHKYPLKRMLAYKISGFFIKKSFYGVSGNTEHAKLSASKLFHIPADKIMVTYNGLDFSLLKPTRSKAEVLAELGETKNNIVRIGTASNIRSLKRIDYLLQSIMDIRHLKIHCYVIGDGPERQNLETMSCDLGISDLVSFTGKKENIGDYLQILDIFILPSNSQESFGNAAVEAMGMGIPTIVMRDGGGLVEHIVKDSGFIAEHARDITVLLQKLIQSKKLRRSVGEKGKVYVREKYSVENMVKSYTDFYSSFAQQQ